MANRDGQPESETAVFRWECPICAESRVCIYLEKGYSRVKNDLRTHIRSTREEGHGPENRYPEAINPYELDEFVHRVEE